jgi:alcohol dehydrogenase class IV
MVNFMQFQFATATRIVFGKGTSNDAITEAVHCGKKAFIVTGRNGSRVQPFIEQLDAQKIAVTTFQVAGEPTVPMVTEAAEAARSADCDMVISIGGGSVIDTGKAVAALLRNTGTLLDYLEVVGKGKKIEYPAAPFIAIPTTAGTGAEVAKNSVITSPEHHVKVSMRSPFMLPRCAIIDPELTFSLPPELTASTGLDALTQCIESYVSAKSNPLTDSLCREGIQRAARSLQTACTNGTNVAAREDMAVASLFSGLALANSGLGAVHGFAGPIGGMIEAPHGTVCALLLPHVIKANVKALHERDPHSHALERYLHVAQMVTGTTEASVSDGVTWIRQLCSSLPVPAADSIAVTRSLFPSVVAAAQKASSMKGNPVTLTEDELHEILENAFLA